MSNSFFDLLVPHYCCSCGATGAILCEHCKYDIVSEPFERCIVCLRPASALRSMCGSCQEPYSNAWCVGERSEALKRAIDLYKYKSTRATAKQLVDLLDATIPQLPPTVEVVAVPTIAPHIRVRGYDHAALIAQEFAKRRQMKYSPVLSRTDATHQQGSTRRERLDHAARAFHCDEANPVPYLLIDDVYTTGATVHYAAQALRAAGASEVYIGIVARQPLEKA